MFNKIIEAYQNETNWEVIDDTKKKLFVFQTFIEKKIFLNYHYYKTIMKHFHDRLIDNEIYRDYPISFDDNDIYLYYGLIGFTLLSLQFCNINIEEFNLDGNFVNLKKFLEKNCFDIDLKKEIYEEKFKKFKATKKSGNIHKDWLNILFSKKLDTINITKNQKRKKIKSCSIIQIKEDGLEEVSIQQDNDVYTNGDEEGCDSKSNDIIDVNKDSNQNKIINKESEESIEEEEQIINPKKKMSDPDESKYKLKEDIELLKKENVLINKKIEELEKMQLFFFHNISLLQNARDTSKSIYYYLYEYLFGKKK